MGAVAGFDPIRGDSVAPGSGVDAEREAGTGSSVGEVGSQRVGDLQRRFFQVEAGLRLHLRRKLGRVPVGEFGQERRVGSQQRSDAGCVGLERGEFVRVGSEPQRKNGEPFAQSRRHRPVGLLNQLGHDRMRRATIVDDRSADLAVAVEAADKVDGQFGGGGASSEVLEPERVCAR